MSTQYLAKIKDFFLKNERTIVLIVAFCLVSAISFEFGLLQGQKSQSKPLVIEKQVNTPQEGQIAQNGASANPQGASTTASTQNSLKSSCAFVGSKNSAIFYIPSCSYAKRIKPENLACYASEQDAISKGKTKKECK
jgi:hypothetical protein